MSVRVGILGAGQLGRMLALAGYPLNVRSTLLDPAADAPAGQLAELLTFAYDDPAGLELLAQKCDVATYEFESVPVAAAQKLAELRPVHPPPQALTVAQDRLNEKTLFRELGIATARFIAVDSEDAAESAIRQLGASALLKTRRLGYDGKGQTRVTTGAARPAFKQLGGVPCILEGLVPFERELSLVGVRSASGDCAFYPLVENLHQGGILRRTLAPAPNLSAALQARAEEMMHGLFRELAYVGVLALELFELENGELLANEIAPRVHNSGHWTIEGARVSQFENHLRAIFGYPLGSTEALGPAAMLNLIGSLPDPSAVLAVPDAHLHDYGKQPRPGRKVGHVTLRAPDQVTLLERLKRVEALLSGS